MKKNGFVFGILLCVFFLSGCEETDSDGKIAVGDTVKFSYEYSCKGELFDQGEKEEKVDEKSRFLQQEVLAVLSGTQGALTAEYDKYKVNVIPSSYVGEQSYNAGDQVFLDGIGKGEILSVNYKEGQNWYEVDFNPCQTFHSFQYKEKILEVKKK